MTPDVMPHFFFDDRTFRPFECELEADFERTVVDHCNDIFGAETVYFDIKKRLVDLNAERRAEEEQGKVRYLHPEYQAPEEAQT